MKDEQFQKLIDKIDVLIRLNALSAVQGKTVTESVIALSDIGIGNTEIAKILGTTPNYVNKIKWEDKRGKTQKPAKEIEFRAEDLLRVLSNSSMFHSVTELRNFAEDILNPQFQFSNSEQKDEMVNQIIQTFLSSDRMKQALFMQALEQRASARELKDTQFLKFLQAWESHIKGSTSV